MWGGRIRNTDPTNGCCNTTSNTCAHGGLPDGKMSMEEQPSYSLKRDRDGGNPETQDQAAAVPLRALYGRLPRPRQHRICGVDDESRAGHHQPAVRLRSWNLFLGLLSVRDPQQPHSAPSRTAHVDPT